MNASTRAPSAPALNAEAAPALPLTLRFRLVALARGIEQEVGVGVLQALVLARHQIPNAWWWALANPPAWSLGWLVTSYVITTNVKEQFAVFGGSGTIVFGPLTLLLLAVLFRTAAPEASGRKPQLFGDRRAGWTLATALVRERRLA